MRNTFVNIHKKRGLLLLALPGILFLIAFNYLPLYGIILPFKNLNYAKGILGSKWIGLKNFEFFFATQDAWMVTRNTILYNLAFIFVNLILSIFFALILFELSRKAVKVHQTLLFIPHFTSWVVAGYIFYVLFNVQYGVINGLLKSIGIAPVTWDMEPGFWPFILLAAYLWKNIGYAILIYYTALMGIDETYYEAASIDGARKLQMIRHITLPLITPIIILITTLALGRIFYSDFGMFYYLTDGKPLIKPITQVIDVYVYNALVVTGDIGMSSAIGLYQSIVGFILVLGTNTIVKRISPERAIF